MDLVLGRLIVVTFLLSGGLMATDGLASADVADTVGVSDGLAGAGGAGASDESAGAGVDKRLGLLRAWRRAVSSLSRRKNLIRLLLKHPALLNEKNAGFGEPQRALDVVAKKPCFWTVDLLLEHGAEVSFELLNELFYLYCSNREHPCSCGLTIKNFLIKFECVLRRLSLAIEPPLESMKPPYPTARLLRSGILADEMRAAFPYLKFKGEPGADKTHRVLMRNAEIVFGKKGK